MKNTGTINADIDATPLRQLFPDFQTQKTNFPQNINSSCITL
jgi:hypothetical protein